MKHFTAISTLISLLLLASCSGIKGMRVQVIRPAKITVKQPIQKIALLNRSIPSVHEGVEGVLTGELPAQDKDLSEECIRGLNELLNTSTRFQVKRCEGTMNAADGKSLSFGNPLSWEAVDSLCALYQTDAIMALEYFDTDYSILNPGATATAAVTSVLNGGNGTVQAQGTAKATAGFRIYDPKTQSIVYEDRFNYKKIWTQQSTNPIDAVAKLIKKNPALLAVSYETGTEFAMNIVPLYYWENRDMYKGKKGAMQIGERQALAKDWESAVKTWTEVYDSSTKRKVRAKAAFNAALGYEVLGDLTQAQAWVQKAYVEGGKSTALRYSNIIDGRVREQAKLLEQEGGSGY